jgi:hypothetical protein
MDGPLLIISDMNVRQYMGDLPLVVFLLRDPHLLEG